MTRSDLSHRRVLIVEDEPFIAFDLADAIVAAGGEVIGPVATVQEALTVISREAVEAAILDVNLPDGDIGPVLSVLTKRGIGLVVHTGGGLTVELRTRYPDLPVYAKPTPAGILAQKVAASFAANDDP